MFDELKPGYLTTEQAAAYIGVKPRSLMNFRKAGILKFIKAGKRFVYRREWIDEMMDDYAGYDLSNPEKISLAINSKKWKEKH